MIHLSKEQSASLKNRFAVLYGSERAPLLMERFRMMLGRYEVGLEEALPGGELWNESDTVLITYADSIGREGEMPLETLGNFLRLHAQGAIRCVHLLPFYPWSSDDGFSVVDYRKVGPDYGSWKEIKRLGGAFDLMFDLVLNHCSRKSQWFRDFILGIDPGRGYFIPIDPLVNLSAVVRPRAAPLLTKTATKKGDQWVWTTFSSDQVDLNWQNPDLLFEFLDILFLYLSKGVRILRLDAVAFLWKELGTNCLHLAQTHEVVKLFRDVLNIVSPRTILLTETNVPHQENLSYFGEGDEAHMVYNFSLPPLLLHGLLRGDCCLLRQWAESLPSLPENETFLNFTASHDGIGVRPLQGLIDESEMAWLIGEVRKRGGRISSRSLPDGSEAPYEMNISYVEALSVEGDSRMSVDRFLCSQAVMLALPGVPAVYINSLLGCGNDVEGLNKTGVNRALNRKKWDLAEINALLKDAKHPQNRIFTRYLDLLKVRAACPAFHPKASLRFLDLGREVLGLVRRDESSGGEARCFFNFTDQPRRVSLNGEGRDFELGPYRFEWIIKTRKMVAAKRSNARNRPLQSGSDSG